MSCHFLAILSRTLGDTKTGAIQYVQTNVGGKMKQEHLNCALLVVLANHVLKADMRRVPHGSSGSLTLRQWEM